MAVVHMIRNKLTDLYSNGGTTPRFTKAGKMWTSMNSLNGHLNLFDARRMKQFYSNCELVRFDLVASHQSDMMDIAKKRQRIEELQKLHNDRTFINLVKTLDNGDLLDKYRWIIRIENDYSTSTGVMKNAAELIKTLKVKKADYRTSGCSFAFSDKTTASKFRLMIPEHTHIYDGETLLELMEIPNDDQ